MTHQTHLIRHCIGTLDDPRQYAAITLPATPGVDLTHDRSETTPSMPVIRIRRRVQPLRGVAKHLRDDRIAERIEAAIVEARAGLELQL